MGAELAIYLIRIGVLILSAAAVFIAAVPLLVLIDLLAGGTGYGLCSEGIEACAKPYSTWAELAILLTVALGGVVVGIRILVRLARRVAEESYQVTQ